MDDGISLQERSELLCMNICLHMCLSEQSQSTTSEAPPPEYEQLHDSDMNPSIKIKKIGNNHP